MESLNISSILFGLPLFITLLKTNMAYLIKLILVDVFSLKQDMSGLYSDPFVHAKFWKGRVMFF